MIFAGVPLAQLLALFGMAGGAVIAFYILKLRRRTVAIPFSPLWARILRDKEATSLFSKLKRLLSREGLTYVPRIGEEGGLNAANLALPV